MKFGTVEVTFLTGETRSYALDLPSALVGRAEGSSIHLDDFSISRRHARLTVDSGRLMVEDLSSAAGTFINGERLTPNVRYLLDDGDELRFGDLEASYVPPPPTETNLDELSDDTTFSPTGLHVALVSPAMAIDPGRQATATLTVTNRGRVVDTFSIEIPDLPADWYTIESPRASLVPGAHVEVQIALHPPRRHDSLAGRYDFTVRVASQEHQREAIAIGSFEVLPFESFSVAFEAVRSSRHFRMVAENRGNQPARLRLSGQDDEQVFRYEFDSPVVELPPGGKQIVALKVRRPRQLLGPRIVLPFEVVSSADSGAEVRARGQLSVDPPLQKFRMPAMFMLAALVLGVTALAVLILTGGETVQTAGAEDEYAGVHLCDDEGAAAEQQEKNSQPAQPRTNPGASVAGTFDGGRPIFGQVDSNGAPFFAQNDPRWASVEYARSTELPAGKDWCGTTISQCGCAMTSVAVMLALYNVITLPDGQPLTPQSLNAWFNGEARRTDRGWVSRGYIYGDVIWTAANELSGEIAKMKPGTPTVRFVRTGSGSEDEIRAELRAGRPIILEVPGHWIAAVGLDGDTILINDPFYRDRTTLDAYKGNVRSSVIYEPSSDLSAVVLTAPSDVKFRVVDKQGRVVGTGDTTAGATAEPIIQIPGASVSTRRAWRDPTCIEKPPPPGAGTHQIVLPGSRDDYRIEILSTGDQGGSVAIHTYGRDGTASIATIEGQEGTSAELDYDPNAPAPVVRTPGAGQATPRPTGDAGGGGGGPGDGTPTPAATATPSPVPTPTQTPFVEARTNITLGTEPGQLRVETADRSGFELGDPIRFAPGLPNEEDNIIVGFGSFLLATRLKFAHGPGETIQRLPRPPGQGPGLPPGITPPAETGPLLPPDTVGMACSTIYQPSPKQATFICDLQVTGTYTTTRWTLNGQVVPDFIGSSSFLMAFNDDAPATVSATVCNVTICRSVTRAERIVFPANLGGTTFTGPGGTGTGATPVATPPAGGAVAVVCATEFPITPDGQVAQFTCQATFSGDFTSISWSAPGGTPANQSGLSKTFTTTVRNEPGAPVSLRVTATVCNFGTCRTSQPTTVGIGRTVTVLDTDPKPAVHQRHSVTLFAVVKGTGTVVPQGGTVQFYADDIPIGPAATLFTVGATSVAQIGVQTGGAAGLASVGQHTLQAVYSGGINAFGSTSPVGGIEILPPIPDGCDSVDEDPPTAGVGVTDDTCDFSTPKGLGGGTVVNSVVLTGGVQDGAPNAIILTPGQQFTVSGDAARTEYCPGCIRQLYFGIGANAVTGTPAIGPACAFSGGLPASNPGVAWTPVNTADLRHNLRAPTVPGVYYLRATTTLDYFCVGPAVGPPDRSVGRIVVRAQVVAEIEVFKPQDGDTNPWNDNLAGPPADEVDAESRMLVRVRVPAGALGRVDLSLVDANGTPTPALVAPICPPSGQVSTGPAQFQSCTPGEGRVLSPILDVGFTRLTISGRYENPGATRLIDPSTGVDKPYPFYQAPVQGNASNTVELTVLRPSETTLAVTPNGDVPICASAAECSNLVTLTATVGARTPLVGPPATGGEVTFQRRPAASTSDGDWVDQVCVESGSAVKAVDANGQATCQVLPGLDGDAPDFGSYEFRASFTRGSSPGRPALQPSTSDPSDAVTFVRAPATATIVSVTAATDGKVGDDITLVASVAGKNGFDPTGGSVEFKVRPSTAALGSAASIGTARSLAFDSVSQQWRATLTYTTGADNTPLENAGAYLFTAHFTQTATLAADVSDDFFFELEPQDPTITVTLPGSGTITVGDTAVVRVVLTTSGRATRLDDNCPAGEGGSSCGDIELLGTGAATPPSGPVVELETNVWGREFPVSGLDAGTYSITAHYTGNTYFRAVTSDPAQTLTVNKFTPTVTVNTVTSVQVGNSLSLSATVGGTGLSCPGVRCPAGGTISFYKDSVSDANLIGTTGAIATTSGTLSGIPTGGTTLLPTAGGYTIVARYNGDATNGNIAAATSATPTAPNATLTKRTPTVTVDNKTATLGSAVTFTASISTGSAGVSTDCTSCAQFKVGSSLATATNIGVAQNVVSGLATLPDVPTGSGAFAANGSYVIWLEYSGNANVNAGNDSGTLHLAQEVTVSVSVPASTTVGQATTLTATVTPANAPGTVQFQVGGTNIGSAVTLSSGTATYNWTPSTTGSFTVTASYTSTSNNYLDDPDSNTATVEVTPITVTVTVSAASAVTLGSSITLTATLSPAAAPGTVRFFADGVDVSDAVVADTTDGITTYNWLPTSIGDGTATVTATYTSSSGNYASQATSTSTDVTINPAPTTLVATAIQTGGAGSSLTFTADLTSAFGAKADIDGGTVTFFITGTACTGMTAVAVTDGVATLTGVVCAAGTRQVTASYTGGGNFAASADTTNFEIIVT